MAEYSGKTFTQVTENVDGNSYDRCKFIGCTLVYSGGPFPSLSYCEFTQSAWRFADAADRTVKFMSALYHGMGAGGKELIEKTFDNIRIGT